MTTLELLETYLRAYFVEHNPEKEFDLVTDDIHCYGFADGVEIENIEDARKMVSSGKYEMFLKYQLDIEEGKQVADDSAVLLYSLTHNSVRIQYRIAGHSRKTENGNRLYFINNNMVNPFQTLHLFDDIAHARRADVARQLLQKSIPGGIMGGYLEPGYPLYFINENMLQYLGYRDEAQFRRDIDGIVENCVHPDDLEAIREAVEKGVSEGGEYIYDFRMRRHDGTYIWVHSIGKPLTTEDGRIAVLSACYDITAEKEHDRFLQGLVTSLNGDLVMLAVDIPNRRTIPVYTSDDIGKQQGITKDAYLEQYSLNAMDSIYAGDHNRVWTSMIDAIKNDTAPSISLRILEQNGKTKWMNASFAKHGEHEGLPMLLVLFTESTIQNELQLHALNQNSVGVALIDADTKEIYYVNRGLLQMIGQRGEDFAGKSCPEVLHGCGVSCADCRLYKAAENEEYETTVFRNGRWLSLHTEKKPWMDKNVISVYAKDITVSQELREKQEESNRLLKQNRKQMRAILKNMACGMCVTEYDARGNAEIVYTSDNFLKMCESDRETLLAAFKADPFYGVAQEDVSLFQNTIEVLLAEGGTKELTYRFNTFKGNCVWVQSNFVMNRNTDGGSTMYFTCIDVTELKESEKQIRQDQEIMKNACDFAHLLTWVYDVSGDRLFPSVQLQESFGMPEILENYPDSWFQMGFVQPDYVELHRQKVLAIKNGSDKEEFEIRIRHTDGIHWARIVMTRLKENPNLVSCSAQLIDNEKLLQARVDLEKKRILSSEHGLRGYVISNISRNTVYERDTARPDTQKETIGLTIEQAVEKAIPDICEADREKYCAVHNRKMLLEAYQQGKTSFEFIGHRVASDGALYWMRSALNIVQDPDTRDILLYEFIYDIHGQMMTNEIMHAATEHMFERAASINLRTNQMTIISHENTDELQDIIVRNYAKEADAYCQNNVVEEDQAAFMKAISLKTVAAALAEKNEYSFVTSVKEQDGSIGYRRTRFCYYHREMDICLMTRVDVTKLVLEEKAHAQELASALQQAREALMAQNALEQDREVLYAALFNIVPMVIYNNITQNYYNMLNYDRFTTKKAAYNGVYDELIAVGTSTVPDDQKEAFSNTFSRDNILRADENGENCVLLVHQQYGDDGVLRWIETRSILVKDHKTKDLHTITLSQDVTEREQSRLDLQKALETAKSATKAKSEFLSRMSHEIRTPMNAIIGMTSIAQENKSDFLQVSECLEKINLSSHYLLTLLNDILEMSRIESGKAMIHKDEFDFLDLMDGIRTIVERLAADSEIRYECINKADMDYYYQGDRMRIQQILVNIISNAIKFTKKGGRVRFKVESEEASGSMMNFYFSVADTGVGMSEEFMAKMFQPFTQEDGSNTSEYQGSGLGLAIAKNLVESMGGTIEADSFPGVGTTFKITLQLKKMRKSYLYATVKQINAVPEKSIDLKGRRILMAEDHPMNVMIAKKLLNNKGIDVTVADNGKIAVDLFEASGENQFDAILMDIRMPVLDGLEATRAIRALPRADAKTIPIIAMTANALDEDRKLSKDAGMNEHLAKPFEPAQLYQVLAEQIRQYRQQLGNEQEDT